MVREENKLEKVEWCCSFCVRARVTKSSSDASWDEICEVWRATRETVSEWTWEAVVAMVVKCEVTAYKTNSVNKKAPPEVSRGGGIKRTDSS